jgi:HK97 family phage portal protein
MSQEIQTTEVRSSLENIQAPLAFPPEWLLDQMWSGATSAGIRVSEITALQCPAVLACVGIIANAIASLPLRILKVSQVNGRENKTPDLDHDLYDLFMKSPNPEMTAHTWKATLMLHALLFGNHYSEIRRNQRGEVTGIWPLNPAQTRPVRSARTEIIQGEPVRPYGLYYESNAGHQDVDEDGLPVEKTNHARTILASNMIHIRGLSMDGRLGLATIFMCRQVIGLCLATDKLAAKFFGNGAVPLGIITFAEQLEGKAQEEFKRQWSESYGGEGGNSTAVLGPGIKYTQLSTDADKSQFLAAREFQRVEVASIFGVPARMLGDKESKGKTTAEQTGQEFLSHCLGGWINNIEQELWMKLLNTRGQRRMAYFDTQRFRWPDAASRASFYNGGRNFGYLSADDVRELDGMNALNTSWSSKYWMPREYVYCDDPPASSKGPKALAEFAALHPDAPVEEITTPTTTGGTPGLTTPNGGRPIGQHGMRSIRRLMVNDSGTGYEERDVLEYRDAITDDALATGDFDVSFDSWTGLVLDHLQRMCDRKALTFQKYDTSLRPIAESILAVQNRDGKDTVRTITESYGRWKDYKGGRVTPVQAMAELHEIVESLDRNAILSDSKVLEYKLSHYS